MININTSEFKFDPTTLLYQIANNFDFNKLHSNDEMFVNKNEEELLELKSTISTKIHELIYSTQTKAALLEIDNMLTLSSFGGKTGYIEHELKSFPDPDVISESALLSRYILSLNCTLPELTELFALWRADKLVKFDVLLTPGTHDFSEIINGYKTNSAIRDLTNELSRVSAVSQGKGEFLFRMLSRRIFKRSKGDLQIDGINVEVKTTDGGSARLADQDVKPLPGYSSAVEKFQKNWHTYLSLLNIPETGLSLEWIYKLSKFVTKHEVDQYFKDVENIFYFIFPTENVIEIVDALRLGYIKYAKQLYVRANFNYYRSIKVDDDAVLYLNIAKSPAMIVYFNTCDDLYDMNLRLHATSCYPITSKDVRNCYPQVEIKKGASKY